MTHVRDDGGRSPAVALSELLRGWWTAAGESGGRDRPTQQALAVRLRIDQTTLSRYLNPRHPSTAPLRIVEALHSHLGAPEEDLDRARALCRAALEQQRGQRDPLRRSEDAPRRPDAPEEADAPFSGPVEKRRTGPRGLLGVPGPRGPALRALGLVAVAVVAFLCGVGTSRLVQAPQTLTVADDAPPRPSPSAEPEWVLVHRSPEDQLWRATTIQRLLREKGYDVPVDGVFDRRVESAVREIQAREHLKRDGKVGKDTWPFLVKEVKAGMEGEAVLALQELLDNAGQGGTSITGRFGHETLEDLRHFQRTHGLPATGAADVDTWRYLMAHQEPPMRSTPLPTDQALPACPGRRLHARA